MFRVYGCSGVAADGAGLRLHIVALAAGMDGVCGLD